MVPFRIIAVERCTSIAGLWCVMFLHNRKFQGQIFTATVIADGTECPPLKYKPTPFLSLNIFECGLRAYQYTYTWFKRIMYMYQNQNGALTVWIRTTMRKPSCLTSPRRLFRYARCLTTLMICIGHTRPYRRTSLKYMIPETKKNKESDSPIYEFS